MSAILLEEVWQRYPWGGVDLAVFLAIAEAASDTGSAYLTYGQIAEMARVSRVSVERSVPFLRGEYFLLADRIEGQGKTHVYQINLPKLIRTERKRSLVERSEAGQEHLTQEIKDDLLERVGLQRLGYVKPAPKPRRKKRKVRPHRDVASVPAVQEVSDSASVGEG